MGKTPITISYPKLVSFRPETGAVTLQGLHYLVGISGETVGAQGLSMSYIVIPPGAVSEPHMHEGYETETHVLSGRA